MSEIQIAVTPSTGFRRLQVHGQAVVEIHRQLSTILANRLGRQHAQLLSRPEIDPNGSIAWFSAPLGPVLKLAELAEAERRPIETLRRQLLAEIGQLARKMRREGDSAELVAHMLELATITPSGKAAYAVGGQPVLVLWGHATEGQAVPEAPKFVVPPPPVTPARGISPELPSETAADAAPLPVPAAAIAPSAPEAAHTETVAAMGASPHRGWLPWLLPLLLLSLLAVLVWRALQPLSPIVVERQTPASPSPADPIPAEQDREKALRAELAELTKARDERLALCKPITPPPAPEPVAPPELPKVTELAPPPPLPKPRPAPPAAEAKPKPEPPPKAEAKPTPPPEPPKHVAMAPMPPPAPPRSKCHLDVKPGDEPEVVIVVDGSGSMGEPYAGAPSKMSLAKDAIDNMVTGLPPPVDAALIDFSSCDQVRLDKFFPQPERPTLLREVRSLQPDRGTPLARSIQRAGNIVSAGVESTIIVVSDGEDTCGGDPCGAARAVKAKRPNITINVIDLGRGEGQAMMHCIADVTGGKVLTPNSTLDMKNKVQQATRLPDTRNCQ